MSDEKVFGEHPVIYARWVRTMNAAIPDHEIATAWRYASAEECAFWRELEGAE